MVRTVYVRPETMPVNGGLGPPGTVRNDCSCVLMYSIGHVTHASTCLAARARQHTVFKNARAHPNTFFYARTRESTHHSKISEFLGWCAPPKSDYEKRPRESLYSRHAGNGTLPARQPAAKVMPVDFFAVTGAIASGGDCLSRHLTFLNLSQKAIFCIFSFFNNIMIS